MICPKCALLCLGRSWPIRSVPERGSGIDVRSHVCPASGCAYDVAVKGSMGMLDMALPSLMAAFRSLDVRTARGIRSDAW